MKVLAINGSPRAQNSCTAKMLDPVLSGMRDAGATTEIIHLGNLKINHCLGCFSCWTKTPGKCVQNDDMAPLLQKLLEADFFIFGTPLYSFNVTGLMKNFIDRTLPLTSPVLEESKTQDKTTVHPGRYKSSRKKLLLVSPCGFPEFDHFTPLVSYIKYLANRINCDYVGEILRPGAALLKDDNWQPRLVSYYEQLKIAGKQLITNSVIEKELYDKLHQLFISPEEARKLGNEKFAKEIADSK